jgi:hypothetical protein
VSEAHAILHYAERPEHPHGTRESGCSEGPAARDVGACVDAAALADSRLGIALAVAAARLAGHDARALRLDTPPGGKPRWMQGPDFSISHASGIVVCAMLGDGAAVGCDIEAESAVSARDLRLVLDDAERGLLGCGALAPAVIWTRKEAALKWAGIGLRAVNEVRVTREGVIVAGRPLHCRSAMLPGGVIASVVSARAVAGIVVRRHDARALLGELRGCMRDVNRTPASDVQPW